jgi:hypothetical protein
MFFNKKTEIGSNRPVSVRFVRTKTGSNRLAQFFQFDSVFSGLGLTRFFGLARFFPVWVWFGSVF